MAIQSILAGLALADRARSTFSGNVSMERELEAGGTDVPWWKKAMALPFGMLGQEALGMHLEGQVGQQRQADATALRQPDSAGITAAAMKEMEAARNIMRQEVGSGIQTIRQGFGQAGTFQSGARFARESEFRQQGLQSLANSFAGIELDAIQARQSGAANQLALQMQEANFAWQKRQQENAMISSLVSTALPFFMDKGGSGGTPSLDPTQAFGDVGLDPFLAQAPNWQAASPEQTRMALARIGG